MRAVAAAVAAAVGASLLAISGPTNVGAAPVVTEQTRIAGADRYATANAVALARVANKTDYTSVVLVSGENFPDGLAASALAGALNAPMLLTQANSLPTSTLATLTTLTSTATSKNVVIVGGTSAVSADIATQLTATGYSVTRIAGDDRYATANAVAAAARTNNGATIGTFGASNLRTAFLASGTNFPDALAASAQAYKGKHPIFLTNGTTLTDETKAAMTAAGVQQVIILGGTTAVSAEVATAVAGVTGVIASTRIAGDDRYATATALATALGAADATFTSRAYLVSGTNFPDALVAAQIAGAASSGAIIPVNDPLPAAVSTWVTANQATLANIRAIGGTTAVPAAIVTEVKTGATTAPLSATITATDGAASFSVVFSAAVDATTAQTTTNYRVTSALGANKVVSGAVYTAATRTAVVTVTGGLAAGDVVQVLPNSIVSAATAGLFVAAISATVAADTSAPTITIVAYPTTVGAVPSDPSAAKRVWVTFSSNTNLTTGVNVETMLEADLKYTGTTIGSAATSVFTGATGCAAIANTTTYVCNVTTGSLVAGGTISLAASKVTSSASTPVANAATSVTIAADATAPSISSVTFTQAASGTGAVQATRGLAAGAVTISARAGAAADGKAGNAVKIATVATPNVDPACEYSSTLNTVTVSAAVTASALAVANACNTLPAFNTLFVATAHSTNPLVAAWANGAATNMAGGLDVVTLTITTSEAIDPAATFGNLTFANVVGATATTWGTIVASGLSTSETQSLAGVLTVRVTTNGTFTANLTTVAAIASSVKDRAGNAMATTAVTVTAAA